MTSAPLLCEIEVKVFILGGSRVTTMVEDLAGVSIGRAHRMHEVAAFSLGIVPGSVVRAIVKGQMWFLWWAWR